MDLRLAGLLAATALLASAGAASAIPILDLVLETTRELEGCLSTSVGGNAGVGLATDGSVEGTQVELIAPFLTPPGPECVGLPA